MSQNHLPESPLEALKDHAARMFKLVIVLGAHEKEAKVLKAGALRKLADFQSSAIARNYYLAYAKEIIGD